MVEMLKGLNAALPKDTRPADERKRRAKTSANAPSFILQPWISSISTTCKPSVCARRRGVPQKRMLAASEDETGDAGADPNMAANPYGASDPYGESDPNAGAAEASAGGGSDAGW